ncbi:hypothetical protein [Marinobacterium stanieri]|uniref:Phage integrase family protein n=1 Tax=Marinobacterium stanieri TaxID=49186 RepID=A0A1N6XJX8_9GAMM|nr:hypothetical protein [Marinobacterium stanieri]SIR02678.1 hypothetical protein SAMN05421647_11469 [Marinobacterium stanieri]
MTLFTRDDVNAVVANCPNAKSALYVQLASYLWYQQQELLKLRFADVLETPLQGPAGILVELPASVMEDVRYEMKRCQLEPTDLIFRSDRAGDVCGERTISPKYFARVVRQASIDAGLATVIHHRHLRQVWAKEYVESVVDKERIERLAQVQLVLKLNSMSTVAEHLSIDYKGKRGQYALASR